MEAAQTGTSRQIQNYWVSGLFTSFRILNTKNHGVSETGYVSILR
jgi:hypothetical protein